jgi:copper transport protein
VGTAAAHATLISSTPSADEVVAEPPTAVILTFDEPVRVGADGIRVLGPDGTPITTGPARSSDGGRVLTQPVDRAGRGTQTVSYRVLSEDGHVIAGSFAFHVGERSAAAVVEDPSPLPRVLGMLGRWIAFAGAVLAGGVVAMALVVDRRPAGRAWTAGLESSRRLLVPAAAAVLFGSGLALLGSAAQLAGSLGGSLTGLGDLLGSGRTGAVAGTRVLVALVLLVAVAGGALLRAAPWLAVTGVLAALALPSFGGHAATAHPAVLAVPADVGHVLAVAAWVGGLAVLVLTWDAGRDRLQRYSGMALVAAPVVVLTGAVGGWLHVDGPAALLGTDYGRLLGAKVAGTAVMIGLGLWHRRRLGRPDDPPGRLLPTLRVEVALGVALLAVAAVLVVVAPPSQGGADSFDGVERVGRAGSTDVRVQVVPARPGPNDVHVYFTRPDGSPAAVDASELTVSSPSIEPRRVPLTPVTLDHATTSGVQLTRGTWRFGITIVSRGEAARTSVEVPIR